jgi:hypothetical protein
LCATVVALVDLCIKQSSLEWKELVGEYQQVPSIFGKALQEAKDFTRRYIIIGQEVIADFILQKDDQALFERNSIVPESNSGKEQKGERVC